MTHTDDTNCPCGATAITIAGRTVIIHRPIAIKTTKETP